MLIGFIVFFYHHEALGAVNNYYKSTIYDCFLSFNVQAELSLAVYPFSAGSVVRLLKIRALYWLAHFF